MNNCSNLNFQHILHLFFRQCFLVSQCWLEPSKAIKPSLKMGRMASFITPQRWIFLPLPYHLINKCFLQEFITKAEHLRQNVKVKEQLIRNAKIYVAQYHNPETEKEKYQQLVKVLLD